MTKILHFAISKPVLRSFAWRGFFMFDLCFRLVMWRIFFVSEALTSAMKRSGFGGNNSGQCLHQRLWEKGVTRRVMYHEGDVLEGYVSKSRDQKLLWKSIKRNCQYKIIVAQKLRSYRAVMTVIENADRQEAGRWLNNRAENSRLSLRRRERAILRFRRTQPVQKFVSIHASIQNRFNQYSHLYSHNSFKLNRVAALAEWLQLLSA